MTQVDFATCERNKAAEYIRSVYPTRTITDSDLEPILVLVEQDILRVQDPFMYGNRIGIIPGTNHSKENDDACRNAVRHLLNSLN